MTAEQQFQAAVSRAIASTRQRKQMRQLVEESCFTVTGKRLNEEFKARQEKPKGLELWLDDNGVR